MKIKAIIPVLLYLCLLPQVTAAKDRTPEKEFRFRGYTGGMLLHTGYAESKEFPVFSEGTLLGNEQIKGMPMGLGGMIKFGFGTERDILRVGGEGYSSNLHYGKTGSYFHVGWGGLLIDYIHITKSRVYPFAGVTFGGGGVKNVLVSGGSLDDFETDPALIRKYTLFTIAPFAGIEISISKRFRVVLKADYMINIGKARPDYASGPRLHAGFLFCK